jgi:hypothetical protein
LGSLRCSHIHSWLLLLLLRGTLNTFARTHFGSMPPPPIHVTGRPPLLQPDAFNEGHCCSFCSSSDTICSGSECCGCCTCCMTTSHHVEQEESAVVTRHAASQQKQARLLLGHDAAQPSCLVNSACASNQPASAQHICTVESFNSCCCY